MNDVLAWYWIITLMVFSYWLLLFTSDSTTSKLDLTSWCFLLIAPLFWPVVLPVSSWELSRKSLDNLDLGL